MENHEIFLQCDKLFSSNLSHSATVRFGQLEWYKIISCTLYHFKVQLYRQTYCFPTIMALELLPRLQACLSRGVGVGAWWWACILLSKFLPRLLDIRTEAMQFICSFSSFSAILSCHTTLGELVSLSTLLLVT